MKARPHMLRVWAPLAVINFAACVILYLQSNPFLMSRGSDLPNTLVGPSVFAQVLCVMIMLAATMAIPRLPRPWIVAAVLVWVLMFLSAAHRVVIDVVSREVRDVYAFITVQAMPMGDWEGEISDLVAQQSWLKFELREPGGPANMTVFAGIPPGRIEMPGSD